MPDVTASFVALDVGERRIGVATASQATRLASPLTAIINDQKVYDTVKRLVTEHHAVALVVGMPRGMDGQRTRQTELVEAFILQLRQHITLPIYWQDEALTSKKAEHELEARGKPYEKGDVDALAACYILEDFLKDNLIQKRENRQ